MGMERLRTRWCLEFGRASRYIHRYPVWYYSILGVLHGYDRSAFKPPLTPRMLFFSHFRLLDESEC